VSHCHHGGVKERNSLALVGAHDIGEIGIHNNINNRVFAAEGKKKKKKKFLGSEEKI